MPEDCIFFCPLTFGGGWGGGGSCAGTNRVRVILFCPIENEGLHKILQSFLKGHVFFCIPISILQKETKMEESITRQIFLLFFFYQNNGIPNKHNIVLKVLSPLKNKLVLLNILLSDHDFPA